MEEYQGQWLRSDKVRTGYVFRHNGVQYKAHKVRVGKRSTNIYVDDSNVVFIRLLNWQSVDWIGKEEKA
jgi:hypothetical protein